MSCNAPIQMYGGQQSFTCGKMLKFLEQVKLGFIFMAASFTNRERLRNSESALTLNFDPKCKFLQKCNVQFHETFKVKYF